MPTPRIDVIIPHLNDRDRLKTCLDLLAAQTYPEFRVMVVDNGSTQGVHDIVDQYPFASSTLELEKGCGSARNRGVAETDGDILAFTDSDCRPDRDWLHNAVTHLARGKADILAGAIKVFPADLRRPTDVELFDMVFGFEARRYAERKHFATGANIVVSRSAFSRIGPFRNGQYPEDLEWGRRAHAMGMRIAYASDVVVHHPARRTWTELKGKLDRTSWHARNYMGEQPLFRLRWAAYTLGMASPPLIKMAQAAAAPEIKGCDQRLRVMRMLWRCRYYRARVMAGFLLEPAPFPTRREAS